MQTALALPQAPGVIPPFNWYGGKFYLSKRLLPHLPAHDLYVEPFAGSAALFYRKPAAEREIVNDIDYWLMCIHRAIRSGRILPALGRSNKTTKAQWHALRRRVLNEWRSTESEDGATALRLACASYSYCRGRSYSEKQARGRHCRGGHGTTVWEMVRHRLAMAREKIPQAVGRAAGAELTNEDGLSLLECSLRNQRSLTFIDPPYIPTTQGGKRNGDPYHSDPNFAALRELLTATAPVGNAMLTIGAGCSPFFAEALSDAGWTLFGTRNNFGTGQQADHEIWVSGPGFRRIH